MVRTTVLGATSRPTFCNLTVSMAASCLTARIIVLDIHLSVACLCDWLIALLGVGGRSGNFVRELILQASRQLLLNYNIRRFWLFPYLG